MKYSLAAISILAIPAVACAQSPVPPQPPETPNISKVTEDCGDGCTRTVTKTRSTETDADGHQIIRNDVEVIELRADGGEEVDINIDVESEDDGDGEVIVRKKVKVITAGDGEITPEMRAKIDAMITELDGDENTWHHKGDGVMILKSGDMSSETEIIISDEEGEIVSSHDHGSVEIDQTENADGSKTIRITPEDGGETTIITIRKEKSSKSDN